MMPRVLTSPVPSGIVGIMAIMRQHGRTILSVAVQSVAAAATLALLTWSVFRLHGDAATAAVLYLFLIVIGALLWSLIPALLLAIAGTACLDYFFTPPLFRVGIRQPLDIVALVPFALTAVVVTRLVAALRASGHRWRHVFEN